MKILCNGFNLYGQLGRPEHLLEKFTIIFEGYSVEDFYLNHTFSLLKIDGNYKIVNKNEEIWINNCGEFVKICSNDEKLIVLNDKGKLFNICPFGTDTPKQIPNLLDSEFPNEQIVNLTCGSKITVIYTNKGNIYMPHRLNHRNENIIDVQCGKEHCLLLDKSGKVYSFGRGSRGQLGHGHLDDELEPVLLAALGGIKIAQIAAGGWHSCAVSYEGDLYTWGWNGNGQLGLGTQGNEETSISVMATPHVVDFPNSDSNVLKVACGSRHSIALLDNNHLFGCGWNKYKQLNSLDTENYYSFTYLYDVSDDEVVTLRCGPWNSAILCK